MFVQYIQYLKFLTSLSEKSGADSKFSFPSKSVDEWRTTSATGKQFTAAELECSKINSLSADLLKIDTVSLFYIKICSNKNIFNFAFRKNF